MVVVTLLPVVLTVIAAPVVVAGLLSDRLKFSGPSIRTSSVNDRSMTISVMDDPSAGEV